MAFTPVWAPGWLAETAVLTATGPVFDAAGNLYFAPLRPYEDVVLISLDPADGSRRFSIPSAGSKPGGGAPLILEDPDDPGAQVVYLALYDRAVAVRTDGSIVWDVPTGLTAPSGPGAISPPVFGLQWVPAFDALFAVTADGFLIGLDRASGAPVLAAPFVLPGEPSPAVPPPPLPQAMLDAVEADVRIFLDLPAALTASDVISVLLGGGVEVANLFAADPASGRLWLAATAPDGDDGMVDGVSELGALYAYDVLDAGGSLALDEACRHTFNGGSASSPALRGDGQRVYVADANGGVFSIDTTCTEQWSTTLGAQVIGSIAVSADNSELYASTQDTITQLIDQGTAVATGWTASLDAYDSANEINLNLVSIGANGLFFQSSAALLFFGRKLPLKVGAGLLDRETGAIRYFTDQLDETVAVMSTAPSGELYIGHSPFRRAFTRAVSAGQPALVGGIQKYAAARRDLLIRDAAWAGADRAENADAVQAGCAEAVAADAVAIASLIGQMRGAGPLAVAAGEMSAGHWSAVAALLTDAEQHLALQDFSEASDDLRTASAIAAGEIAPVPALGWAAPALLALGITALGVRGAPGRGRGSMRRP